MDTSSLKAFSLMQQKLRYMSERQRIIAQNIANANTPGYKTKDVKMDFGDMVSAKSNTVKLAVTNSKHIQPNKPSGGTKFTLIEPDTSEMTPNGNNVVMEDELMKMQGNNLDYQTTTELYRKMAKMMRTALGDNSGG